MVAAAVRPERLITTYLEMTHSSQFKPSFLSDADVRIEKMDPSDVSFYRFLYRAVGEEWCWRDRLTYSKADLQALLSRPGTAVYVLYVQGSPAGYVELAASKGEVEIAYFGLRSAFHGRGLGKHLLSYGIAQAWRMKPQRVWLHTCNLDGPHALANYRARGFEVTMQHSEPMPDLYM